MIEDEYFALKLQVDFILACDESRGMTMRGKCLSSFKRLIAPTTNAIEPVKAEVFVGK